MNVFSIIILVAFLFLQDPLYAQAPQEHTNKPQAKIFGVAYSPPNFPNSSSKDIEDFFDQAEQVASHVTMILDWATLPEIENIKIIQRLCQNHGLKFHLYLSPIALDEKRRRLSLPPQLKGKSFSDEDVQQEYAKTLLTFAELAPEYLGLGSEVNFLLQNPEEFKAFAALSQAVYKLIKERYPAQNVTISFQWDMILTQKQFDLPKHFAKSLDVYAFTTYPSFFQDAQKLPVDYYSCVRKILPKERLGFSEVGWTSAAPNSEEMQANFFLRLPEMMEKAKPEFITLALLNDVVVFTGGLADYNSVGIRKNDGTPKKAWAVVLNFNQPQKANPGVPH
jgi:hypothetical protein